MGAEKRPPATGYLRKSAPGIDGKQTWSCISRRTQKDSAGVPHEALYRQIPGGPYGMALAVAVVIELQHPGRYVREDMHIQRFARRLHSPLEEGGIYALTHDYCRISTNADSISNDIVDQSQRDAIMNRTQEFNPRISTERYDRTAEAFGRIVTGKLISPPTLSRKGLALAHEPLRAAWLDNGVDAVGYIANWWDDWLYDAQWGAQQHSPMIHASLADLSYIHDVLKPISGGELHDLQDVISVFLGAISTNTLLDGEGHMLPIHRVGEPEG